MFFSENSLFRGESNIIRMRLCITRKKVITVEKKRVLMKALTLMMIFLAIAWTINIQTSKGSKTLVVHDNFSTINAAVNAASQGDTILVKSGVYFENLQINMSLTLQGEDPKNTIIIGSGDVDRGANSVITLEADNVKISGFTIESLNYSTSSRYATGINIEGDNCTIADNIIQNTYIGIFCSIQSSTVITQNNITANIKDGVRFFGGSLNRISDNVIDGNKQSGIAMEGYSNEISKNRIENNVRGIGFLSSYSVIFGNSLNSNTESGIYLAGSYNIISSNVIGGNKWGIYVTTQLAAPRQNEFYENNLLNNYNNVYYNSSSAQYWDNSTTGNYWSDYLSRYPNATEITGTQIGNTPYLINSTNVDYYPSLTQFSTSSTNYAPVVNPPAPAEPNSVIALWSFDTIQPDGVTPDTTGKNPAVLASTGNVSYTPVQIDGKNGKALSFNGAAYIMVPTSPSLETLSEVTIDVWINVQAIKNAGYNNIFVESERSTAAYPTRTLGLAVNGETPQNATSPPEGALRAYVFTKNGGLNEIDTKDPVPLNKWIHVVFTRSLTSGMHIYIDGQEKQVDVAAGVANPVGSIEPPNEIYIGHDSIQSIDELQISNMVEPSTQSIWNQWWLWAIIFVGAGIGVMLYLKNRGLLSLSKTKL